jgi:hypothetical protein
VKIADPALITFLDNATEYVYVDCYTFGLNDNVTKLRYSGTNMPVVVNGHTFNLGPPIQDEGVQSTRGVSSSKVDLTILGGDGRATVNGLDILDFIEGFGLDNAGARIDRAFAASWDDFYTNGPVGSYIRFAGTVGEIKELGQTQAVVTINSFMDVLDTQFPAETYGTSCLNTFGDANCGVDKAALAKTGAVTGLVTEDPTAWFNTNLTDADNFWTLGTITFTSGVNEGLLRSIKTYFNTGGVTRVTSPLPAPPGIGDTFSIEPGCLLSVAACQGWDNPPFGPKPTLPFNQRFRGTPFIPPPTTGLPS